MLPSELNLAGEGVHSNLPVGIPSVGISFLATLCLSGLLIKTKPKKSLLVWFQESLHLPFLFLLFWSQVGIAHSFVQAIPRSGDI